MQGNNTGRQISQYRLIRSLVAIVIALAIAACTASPVNLQLANMLNIPDVSEFTEIVKNGDSLILIKSRDNKQALYVSENYEYRQTLPLKDDIRVLDFFDEVYQNAYTRYPGLSPFGKLVYTGPNDGEVVNKERIEKDAYVLYVFYDNGPGFIAYAVDRDKDIVITLHGKNINSEILKTIN